MLVSDEETMLDYIKQLDSSRPALKSVPITHRVDQRADAQLIDRSKNWAWAESQLDAFSRVF